MWNPPVSVDDLRPLDEEPWQPVSPRYAIQLRVQLLIFGLVFAALPWFFAGTETAVDAWVTPLSSAVALFFLAMMIFWVPRRVRHTRYLLRQLDMNMQTGLLWRRTTSVALNRVQHLEITQGPLERALGLSRLILYTAGGMKSDLVLPGLVSATAHALKAEILDAAELAEQENTEDDVRS